MTDGPHEELPRRYEPAERPRLGESLSKPGATSHQSQAESQHVAPPRRGGCLRETAFVLIVALAISVVVKTFFVQSFYIPSSSMESTLMVDDRIIVNKMAGDLDELNRGDVVVFVDPGGWLAPPAELPSGFQKAAMDVLTFIGVLPQNAGEHLIKRVIGFPGDRVSCCSTDGRLSVNGTDIAEPYLDDGVVPSEVSFEVIVPEGSLWMMGDNRQDSRDSRAQIGQEGGGFVPVELVSGRAAYIVYPFDRMSWLGGGDAAFVAVPDP